MTVAEFYQLVEGDYANVKELFMADPIILKFIRKFAQEGTYQSLMEAVQAGDIEASFAAAHTLKGVAGNIGLSKLQQAASELTEQLRPRTMPAEPALVEAVQAAYRQAIEAIEQLG